jgi:hypothetical protein
VLTVGQAWQRLLGGGGIKQTINGENREKIVRSGESILKVKNLTKFDVLLSVCQSSKML